MLCKEFVWPTLMIAAPATSCLAQAFAEEASQPHPYPPVQEVKREAMAVFEILKPTSQPGREVVDDLRQAFSRGPFRLLSDCVFELLHALGSRVALPPYEPIAQKIKGLVRRVNDLSLLRDYNSGRLLQRRAYLPWPRLWRHPRLRHRITNRRRNAPSRTHTLTIR